MEHNQFNKKSNEIEKKKFLCSTNDISTWRSDHDSKNKEVGGKAADFIIMGIPIEYGSTHNRGNTSKAPDVMRFISDELGYITETNIDLTTISIFDAGDFTIKDFEAGVISNSKESGKLIPALHEFPKIPDSNEELNSLFIKNIGEYISNNFERIGLNPKMRRPIPIFLGGNHYITIPLFNYLFNKTDIIDDQTLFISLDAHLDFYDNWERNKNAHCTVTRRIYDLFTKGSENILLFGVRDIDVEEYELAKQMGLKYYTMHQIHKSGLSIVDFLNYLFEDPSLDKVVHKANGDFKDVYLSVDLDVLDPSIAGATGYPIPGGFSYRELHDLLEWLTARFPIRVIDFVEYAPDLDTPNYITGFTFTRLLLELIGMIYRNDL